MKILDKIPQQQPKLKISKRTFLKIFCSFLFSRGLINCDLFNSLYFSLFRNGTSFLLHLYFNNKENMKVVEEYRQEYWRTALVYKLGNDWVVCDPYLALNADSIEKGIRYLL